MGQKRTNHHGQMPPLCPLLPDSDQIATLLLEVCQCSPRQVSSASAPHDRSGRRDCQDFDERAAWEGRITANPQSTDPMAADGKRYGAPDAFVCEARARAWVSMYSRILLTLPFRTVMSKTQSSLNDLLVALIFPVSTPTTRTRSPCATNSIATAVAAIQRRPLSANS